VSVDNIVTRYQAALSAPPPGRPAQPSVRMLANR
jgi:hypothetical protein